MRKVNVLPGQTIFDIILQEKGSLEGMNSVLKDNALIPGAKIISGDEIIISGEPSDREAYRYIVKNGIKPATSIDEMESQDVDPGFAGIGYWKIDDDFIIQ